MKSNVERIYKVELSPYNDDEDTLDFSVTPLKTGTHTVQFDISYCSNESGEHKYIGYHDGTFWYIDLSCDRGLFLNTPLDIETTADDLSEIDEYDDEEECVIIAKSIEMLIRDFFSYKDDLTF